MNNEAIALRVKDLIAVPSIDPNSPSPHVTGAFDISLRRKQANPRYVEGAKLFMGNTGGETSQRVYPDYFERWTFLRAISLEPKAIKEARWNRRAFAAIMSGAVFGIETGFVTNPTEWWHYSRGDQLWARVNRLQGNIVTAYRGLATLPKE